MRITPIIYVLLLAHLSMAYTPDRFNSSDNITLSDLAPKLADAVGIGLVDTGNNAENLMDYFVISIFFFIVISVIIFGKDFYQTWRNKR